MLVLYNFAIWFYGKIIALAALFKPKAKLWIEGRQLLFEKLESDLKFKNSIWFHCSSLGEFEQGRPLIEAIKKKYPEEQILLTFFSPSGYELRKDYKYADQVVYLPLDTKQNANLFLSLVDPKLVIFVKYEFWYHFLTQLKNRSIPTFLVSATFRPGQIFFRFYGGLFRKILMSFHTIFVQDQKSQNLLQSIDVKNVQIAGDTRVDRVDNIAKQAARIEKIEKFKEDCSVFILGSSWEPDEKVFIQLINENKSKQWKFIIAPHDVSPGRINAIQKQISAPNALYSSGNEQEFSKAKVLIIDNIGMLSSIYQYGKLAYVGGGFGAGIHNTLEPIAYGLPVLFGPNFEKFEEAKHLVKTGGAFVINNYQEIRHYFSMLLSEDNYSNASFAAREFIDKNIGATGRIIEIIEADLD